MLLLDANVVLELLLDQEQAVQVRQFLAAVSLDSLYISRFALDTIGVILFRRKKHKLLAQTVNDLLIRGGLHLIQLDPEDVQAIEQAALRFNLDFDDAYQCVAAEKYNLTLVSFDADFDRTERGRKTPAQILETL